MKQNSKLYLYNKNYLRQQRAFTIYELSAVVTIISLLSLIAIPMMRRYQQDAEATRVKQILTLATREAQIRSFATRSNLIVCPADKDNQCNRMAKDKIIVFTDYDNNQKLDNLKELQVEYPLLIKHGSFEMRMSLHRHYMKYFGDSGHPKGHYGHFRYCSESSKPQLSFKVVVSHIGYVSEQRGCS